MRRSLSLLVIATLFVVCVERGQSQQPAPAAAPVQIQGGAIQVLEFSKSGKGGPTQGTFQLVPGQGAVQFQERSRGQGPGGPGGGGPGRMMGMMGGDPMTFFNMLSRGKDTINRNDLEEWQQRMFDRMAPSLGITNGQMTRDQFRQAAETMRSRMQNGGGPGGPGGGNFGAGMSPDQMDRFATERFRRADINGDGLLQVHELSERLRPVWEKFDANRDGAIDLNEYKSYMRSAFQQEQANAAPGQQPANGQPPPMIPDAGQPVPSAEDEERKPTVYRAGKLPKDIPAWFEQLDLDKDGQIGLYEWIRGGKAIDEFRPMDRNDDGFLTADEVMTFVHQGDRQPGSQGNAVAFGGGNNAGAPAMFNQFGGGGNMRMFNAGGGNNDDSRGRGRGPGAWSGEGNGRMRGGPRGGGENGNGGFNRGPRGGDGNNNGGNGGFNRGPRGDGDGNNNGGFNRGPRGGDGNNNRGFNRGPRGGDGNNTGGGNGRNSRGNYRYDPYSDPTLP